MLLKVQKVQQINATEGAQSAATNATEGTKNATEGAREQINESLSECTKCSN